MDSGREGLGNGWIKMRWQISVNLKTVHEANTAVHIRTLRGGLGVCQSYGERKASKWRQ